MASEKQIQANRLNALKGGVKTEAGKAAIRLNAVSHGFFSKDVLIPGEDPSMMTEFRDNFMAELKPVGEMETLLIEIIISSSWRMKRILRSERKYIRIGTDYRFSNHENVMRYVTTLERQIYKAMHELDMRQKARLEKDLVEISALALEISSSESEIDR